MAYNYSILPQIRTSYTLCRPAGRRRMALAKQSIATTVEGYDPFSNLCGAVHRNSLLGFGVHFIGQPGLHTSMRDIIGIISNREQQWQYYSLIDREARGCYPRLGVLNNSSPCVPDPVALNMDHCRLPSRHFRTPRDRHFALHGVTVRYYSAGVTANNHTPQVRLP